MVSAISFSAVQAAAVAVISSPITWACLGALIIYIGAQQYVKAQQAMHQPQKQQEEIADTKSKDQIQELIFKDFTDFLEEYNGCTKDAFRYAGEGEIRCLVATKHDPAIQVALCLKLSECRIIPQWDFMLDLTTLSSNKSKLEEKMRQSPSRVKDQKADPQDIFKIIDAWMERTPVIGVDQARVLFAA